VPAAVKQITEIARVGLELFFAVTGKLQASETDQATLLGVTGRTVRRYRSGDIPEAHDTLERISHLATIWLDLNSLFRTEGDALRWLESPNEKFGGQSPYARMLAGNVSDLVDVRYDVESALNA
jgi:uncharacterized protein (DUF2384 family)